MPKLINIKDTKPYLLDDNMLAYRIEKGSANVYISEFDNGKPNFRLFLKELKAGDVVSGMSKKHNGSDFKLFLVNSTRSDTEDVEVLSISTLKTSPKIKKEFLDSLKLLQIEKDYDHNLIQHYLLHLIKGSRNIYSEELSDQNAAQETARTIKSGFSKEQDNVGKVDSNDIYFALSSVAKSSRVSYVAFQDLDNQQRSSLDPYSFAEYSSCICKKINLEDNWYNHDIGNFVVYLEDNREWAACIFRNNNYYYLSKSSPTYKKITKSNSGQFPSIGYALYRTLPDRKIELKDIFRYIWDSVSAKALFSILFMGLLVSIIGLITPIITQFIYDTLIPNSDIAGLFGCACVLFAMIIGTGTVTLVKSYASLAISSKIKYSLQIALFDRVFKLRQSFIKKFEPADLSMRVLGVGNIFTSITTTTVAAIITFIFSFIYLFQMYSFMPSLAFPAIVLTVVMFVVLIVFANIQYKWYRESAIISIEKSSFLYQMIRGISKLRISGAENRAINNYMDKHTKTSVLNYKSSYYSALIGLIGTLFSGLAMIIFYTIVYSDGLAASVGSLNGFITAYGVFTSAVLQIPTAYISYLQAKPWIERLKPVMAEVPENSILSQSTDAIAGEIDVRHVSFAYEADSPIVLDDLSLSIKKGEYVGIVGTSGCGKSTLLNLLLGFEHQDKGKIYYDHHDLDEMNKKELRKNFGVVLQDGDIVSGSIYDNIAIAKPGATMDEVMNVLDKVGILDEVNNMPMGVLTNLSEGSGLISGGQKQRILIARALINNPKILFMDEATSALDNIVQAQICNYIKTINCTKVVIAHRLSTIINCDRIYVIDEGKVAETGTYDDLMKQKGIFYNLARRQLS